MDVNIQLSAGSVTQGADSALKTLERIKALVESTEPITSKLSRDSRLDVSQQLQALKTLTQQAEATAQRLKAALTLGGSGIGQNLRKELTSALNDVRTQIDSVSRVSLKGPDTRAMNDGLKQVRKTMTELTSVMDQLGPSSEASMNAIAAASRRAASPLEAVWRKMAADSKALRNDLVETAAAAEKTTASAAVAAARASAVSRGGKLTSGVGAAEVAAITQAAQAHKSLTGEKIAGAAATTRLANTSSSLTSELKEQLLASNNLHSAYRGLASGFGAMWLTWGNVLPLLAGAAISHSIAEMVRSGAELDHTFKMISALGEVAASDVAKMNEEVIRLGQTSTYGPQQAAEALKTLTLAGLSAKESLQALPTVLNFAKVGELGLDKAAETLVAVGTAYGYSAEQYSYVSDVIAKTAAVSMVSVADMSSSFQQASAIAQQYKVSLEDTAVSLALLGQANIRGSKAGTSVRQMYNELMGSSKKAQKALDELGVSILDNVNGKMKPLKVIIEQLSESLKGMSFEGVMKTLQAIGNERGTKALAANMQAMAVSAKESGKEFTSEFDRMMKAVNNAAGFTAEAAHEMDTSTKSLMQGVGASIETLMVSAFAKAKPAVDEFLLALRAAFNSEDLVSALATMLEWVSKLAQGVLWLATTWVQGASAIGSLLGVFGSLEPIVVAGALALGAFAIAARGVQASSAALAASAAEVAAAKAAEATAVEGANVAMSAAPAAAGRAATGLRVLTGALGPLAIAITAAYTAWMVLQSAFGQSTTAKAVSSIDDWIKQNNDRQADYTRQAEAIEKGADAARAAELSKREQMWGAYNEGVSKDVADARARVDALNAELADMNPRSFEARMKVKEIAAQEAVANQRINQIMSERQKLQDRMTASDKAAEEARTRLTKANQDRQASELKKLNSRIGYGDKPGVDFSSGRGAGHTKNPAANEEQELRTALARNAALSDEIALMTEFPSKYSTMTEAEKKLYLVKQQLNSATADGARAWTAEERSRLESLKGVLEQQAALESQKKALTEAIAFGEKAREAGARWSESTAQSNDALREQIELSSNSKFAKEAVTLATLKESEANRNYALVGGKWIEVTKEMVTLQQEKLDLMRQLSLKQLSEDLDKQTREAQYRVQAARDELTYLGMTEAQQRTAQALRKIDIDQREKLLEIDKQRKGLETLHNEGKIDDAEYEKQLKFLNDSADLIDENAERLRKLVPEQFATEEIARFSRSINDSLSNAFMDAFENGGSYAKRFIKALKQQFNNLVLQPIISFIVAPISQAIGGVFSWLLGGATGGTSGGGGVGGWLNNASTANSLWSAFSGTGGNYGAISGALSGNMGWANAAGSVYANTASSAGLYGGSSMDALFATNGAYGTAGASGTGWLGTAATGAAVVAAPLIIGSMVEANTRERVSGAAYATSDYQNDAYITASGADYDPVKGVIPDHSALVDRATAAGVSQSEIDKFGTDHDRAFLHYIRMREVSGKSQMGAGDGASGVPSIDDILSDDNMYAGDFYRGQGYTHPEAEGWWNDKGYDLNSNSAAATTASRAIATSIVEPLTEINKALGHTADDFKVTVGYATRGEGKGVWAGLKIQQGDETLKDWTDKKNFHSVQDAIRGMYSEALDTLSEMDLPDWAKKQATAAKAEIDKLEGDDVGTQASAAYQTATTAIAKTIQQIQTLINVFPNFTNATQDSVYAIGQMMGGLDNLTSSYNSYLQNFYSDSERKTLGWKQLEDQFKQAGIDTIPHTRKEFRDLVDSLDLSTEAGQKMFAMLMALSPAFAELVDATEAAFGATDSLTSTLTSGILGTFQDDTFGTDVGAAMAKTVQDGVYNAIAGHFAAQITSLFIEGLINPLITAAVTGTSITAAVSSATIESIVAQAKAVAGVVAAILNDPEFKAALDSIGAAIGSIDLPTATQATSSVNSYSSAVSSSGDAAESAAKSISDAYSEAKSNTDDIWTKLDKLWTDQIDTWQGLLDEAKAIFDLAKGAAKDLRGDSDATAAGSYADANAFISSALDAARTTGSLPDQEELSSAIDAVKAYLVEDNFSSNSDLMRARLSAASRLDALGDIAGTEKTYAQQQVDLLTEQRDYWKEQIDLLREEGVQIATIAEGIPLLIAAIDAERAAKLAADAAGASGSGSGSSGSGSGSGSSYDPWDGEMRRAAAEQRALLTTQNGWTPAQYDEWLISRGATDPWIGQFATGGYHRGGLRIVGERGRELEATGPSYIFNNALTERMLGGDDADSDDQMSYSALVEEMRALREQVARMAISTIQTARNTQSVDSMMRKSFSEGEGTTLTVKVVD